MLLSYTILSCLSVFLSKSILGFVSLPFLCILCIYNLSLSFSIVQVLLTRLWGTDDPPRVDSLPSEPRVAVLYLTCDDLDETCIQELGSQSYAGIDVFVLDDSVEEVCRKAVDGYSSQYRIVRRADRRGRKAGNLNNWLRLYGDQYPFFIILDSDSRVGGNFAGEMLRYALHPANSGTAVFQAVIEIWNRGSLLSQMINAEKERGNRIALSLYNQLGFYFGWGHNALYRTSAVLDCGGFGESYVGEDIELGLRLMERGFRLAIVNILSYEGIAKDIFRYSVREGRICQSLLQVLSAKRWSIAPSSYFFLIVLNLSALLTLPAMALNAAIVYNAAVVRFGPLFAAMYLEYYSSDYLAYNIAMFVVYLVFPVLVDVLALPSRSGLFSSIVHKIRLVAYNLSLTVYLFSSVVSYFWRRRVSFHVTNSRPRLAGHLVVQYAVSAGFYLVFSIAVCSVAPPLCYPFSIWFAVFGLLSAVSVHLMLDSLRRRPT